MNNGKFTKLAATGILLGTALIGYGPVARETSSAFAGTGSRQTSGAEKAAKDARKSLSKHNPQKAVTLAERAVGLAPADANYRMLLGEAYLAAGRYSSAEASFADVMDLSPANDRAALRLALTRIALGKPEAAQALLQQNKAALPAADYGLATALAGDLDGGIATLENVIRGPASDARARQNLALAYALAGRWPQARVLASQDLSPELVDARMTQWAVLARPKSAWDQVASVLGVQPINDPGQPIALALNRAHSETQLASAPEAVSAPVIANQNPVPTALFEVGTAAPAPTVAQSVAVRTDAAPEVARFEIEFAPHRAVVQPLPAVRETTRQAHVPSAPLIRAQKQPMKVAASGTRTRSADVAPKTRVAAVSPKGRQMIVEVAKPRSVAVAAKSQVKPVAKPAQVAATKLAPKPVATSTKGKVQAKPVQTVVATKTGKQVQAGQFVVQLGAFGSKAAAESVWAKTSSKVGGFGGHAAMTAQVSANGKTFERLAVSGFNSSADAQQACAKVKAAGGQCFVKSAVSDGSRWAALKPAKAVQLASR